MFGWLKRTPPPPPPPTEQQLRLTQALEGYPLYAPPEWKPDPDIESRRAASAQYGEYFLGSTQARLDGLRAFLANFDISMDCDDAGLMAVSTWLPDWADLLIDDFRDRNIAHAYKHLVVPWTGRLSGLNVAFDLGIYYAECLLVRRTKLDWFVHRGLDSNGDHMVAHFMQGLPGGKWFDPIFYTYMHCWNVQRAKIAKKEKQSYYNSWMLEGDSFSRHVLAKTPPGRRSRKAGGANRTTGS